MAEKKPPIAETELKKIQKAQQEQIPAGLFEVKHVNQKGFSKAYDETIDKIFEKDGAVAAVKYMQSKKGQDEVYDQIMHEVKNKALDVLDIGDRPAYRQNIATMGYLPNGQELRKQIQQNTFAFDGAHYQEALKGTIANVVQNALLPLQTEFKKEAVPGIAKILGMDKYAKDVNDISRAQIADAVQDWDQGKNPTGVGLLSKLGIPLKDMYKGDPDFKGVYKAKKWKLFFLFFFFLI